VASSELVLSRTAVVAISDDSLAERDTPLLLTQLLLIPLLMLSGRTTRLGKHEHFSYFFYFISIILNNIFILSQHTFTYNLTLNYIFI